MSDHACEPYRYPREHRPFAVGDLVSLGPDGLLMRVFAVTDSFSVWVQWQSGSEKLTGRIAVADLTHRRP